MFLTYRLCTVHKILCDEGQIMEADYILSRGQYNYLIKKQISGSDSYLVDAYLSFHSNMTVDAYLDGYIRIMKHKGSNIGNVVIVDDRTCCNNGVIKRSLMPEVFDYLEEFKNNPE